MNKTGNIHTKELKKSYWCPECGKLIDIASEWSVKYELEYDGKIEFMSEADINFTIVCNECDSYMLPIDYFISRQIKKLNDMGYKTSYCCSGHLSMVPNLDTIVSSKPYKYIIEAPYISFANIPENEYCKYMIKNLLTLQEFGFITLEEYGEDTWTIRAQVDMIEIFNDTRNGFIKFIDNLILNLDGDKEGD